MAFDEGFEAGFNEAVDAALAELGEATPDAPVPDLPSEHAEVVADDNQAEIEPVTEQPEPTIDSTEDVAEPEELFADLEDETTVEEDEDFVIVDEDDLIFDLPGVADPVTMQELKDGYLRQADYTRKTQAVAAEKQQHEDAVKFWNALKENPTEVLTALAVEAGIISPGQQPVRQVEFSPLATTEQVEAEIERRVAEAVKTHPEVQKASLAQAEQLIKSEFDRIEETHQVKLGPKSRRQILREASRRGVTDLELVFKGLMADRQSKAAAAEKLRGAAPSKPTRRVSEREVNEPPADFDDAFERALAEAGIG